MINFNDTKEIPSNFGGSELKKAMIYQGDVYMVKFPDPVREKKNLLSYMNNQFSEHIGCEIFKSCGILVQETRLGYYNVSGKEKIVVACKDFTKQYGDLIEFDSIAKANVESGKQNKLSIEKVYDVINTSKLITEKSNIIERFWDMFVVDALIGNSDRHLSNWGLVKNDDYTLTFAPVYDCGSSLSALLSDDKKEILLQNETEFKNIEYNIQSVYLVDGKRIYYHDIFKNPSNDLKQAIERIVPKIDINAITSIIENHRELPSIHKEYMIKSIKLRYDLIIHPSLKQIQNKYKRNTKKTMLLTIFKGINYHNKSTLYITKNS